jgi:hypothetical protein
MFNVLRREDSEDSFESEKGLVVHEIRVVYCQEYTIPRDVKTDKRHHIHQVVDQIAELRKKRKSRSEGAPRRKRDKQAGFWLGGSLDSGAGSGDGRSKAPLCEKNRIVGTPWALSKVA